jgi:hypothetical protein
MAHKVVRNKSTAVIFGNENIVTLSKSKDSLDVKDKDGRVVEKLGFLIYVDGINVKDGDKFADTLYGYKTKKIRDQKFSKFVARLSADKKGTL